MHFTSLQTKTSAGAASTSAMLLWTFGTNSGLEVGVCTPTNRNHWVFSVAQNQVKLQRIFVAQRHSTTFLP